MSNILSLYTKAKNTFSSHFSSHIHKYALVLFLNLSFPTTTNHSSLLFKDILYSNSDKDRHITIPKNTHQKSIHFTNSCYSEYERQFYKYNYHDLIDSTSTRLHINLNDRVDQQNLTIKRIDRPFVRGAIIRHHADSIRNYIVQCIQQKLDTPYPKLIITLMTGIFLDDYATINYPINKPSLKKEKISLVDDIILLPSRKTFEQLLDKISTKHQLDSIIKKRRPHFKPKNILSETLGEGGLFDNLNQCHKKDSYVDHHIVSEYIQSHGHRLWSTLQGYMEDGSSIDFFRTGAEIAPSAFAHLQEIITQFDCDHPNDIVTFSGMRELGHSFTTQGLVSTKAGSVGKLSKKMTHHQRLESHEGGHCIDLRMIGREGVVLYQWIKNHTLHLGANAELKTNKRYTYVNKGVRFEYIYHGIGTIGKHFHVYLR